MLKISCFKHARWEEGCEGEPLQNDKGVSFLPDLIPINNITGNSLNDGLQWGKAQTIIRTDTKVKLVSPHLSHIYVRYYIISQRKIIKYDQMNSQYKWWSHLPELNRNQYAPWHWLAQRSANTPGEHLHICKQAHLSLVSTFQYKVFWKLIT